MYLKSYVNASENESPCTDISFEDENSTHDKPFGAVNVDLEKEIIEIIIRRVFKIFIIFFLI
jgi:hypothetical protein